jgi:thymidylate kinase
MALFTVIEGSDACGKTTQVKLLVQKLQESGLCTVEMSFPRYATVVGNAISKHLKGTIQLTDTVVGNAISNHLKGTIQLTDTNVSVIHKYPQIEGVRAEEDGLVFQALQTMDKYEAAADILVHLKQGTNVVSSRWWQSAIVYGADMGLDLNNLTKVHALLPRADLNVLIWLPEAETKARRPDMRDWIEKDSERQHRVREAYRQMWAERGSALSAGSHGRRPREDFEGNYWLVVDGRDDESQVHGKIWKAYLSILEKRSQVQRSVGS